MSLQFTMNQSEITKTIKVINELNQKFPLMDIEDIHNIFDTIQQQTGVLKHHFNALLIFINWLKSQTAFIDIMEVKRMNVKVHHSKWTFKVKSINGHVLDFKCKNDLF